MFVTTIPKEFKQLDGKPFLKFKEDKKTGDFIRVLDDDGKPLPPVKDALGNVGFRYQREPMNYLDALSSFLNALPDTVSALFSAKQRGEAERLAGRDIKPLKMEDSADAAKVFAAIHVAEGAHKTLEMEDHEHNWLVGMLKNYGIDQFGLHVAAILAPLETAQNMSNNRAQQKRNDKR